MKKQECNKVIGTITHQYQKSLSIRRIQIHTHCKKR